jgi:transporter family-2 protein
VNNGLFFVLALAGGSAIAIQVAVNTQLRHALGPPMQATLCSVSISLITALVYCLIAGYPIPEMERLRKVPAWGWIGGVLGVVYLWCSVVVSPRLGVALTLCLVIIGQMSTSIAIDHFGLFRSTVRPVSLGRAAGVALMAVGVILVARYRE